MTKRVVTLTSGDGTKMYDGTALKKGTVTVGGDGWADGEGATYTVTGSQLNAGESANTFSCKLNDGTLRDNYSIEEIQGTLTVTKRNVTLTSDTDSKEYDGTALTNSNVTAGGDGWADGEGATCTVSGTQTYVGTSENTFTYSLITGTKTDNYTIDMVFGTLTVTGAPVEPHKTTPTVTSRYALGDQIPFTITVKNITDHTLTNITVTEQAGAVLVAGSGYTVKTAQSAVIASLASGSTVSIQAYHIVTSEDILNGTYENTVSISAENRTVTATGDTDMLEPPDVTMTVTKTSDIAIGDKAVGGQTIHYCSTMLISNILTLLSGILLLVFAVRQLKYGTKSDSMFFGGLLVLFCAGLVDLLRINLFKYVPMLYTLSLPSILAVGMLLFVVFLLRAYLADNRERQQTFDRMQLEAEMLSKTIDNIPTGVCQLIPNEELTIVSANDIFYHIIGYDQEDLQTARPKSFFNKLLENERAFVQSKVTEALAGPADTGEFEISTLNRRGEALTTMVRYFYDRNGSGNITANIIDITDRKHIEDELRISEMRYRLALSQSGKVFFYLNVKTRTMVLSDELAQAFSLPNEVENMPDNFIAQGLVEPQSVDNYRRFYERIYAGEPSGDTIISCHMLQAPDTVLWYRISFTSIFDQAGKPASAIIIYEDIMDERDREINNAWRQLDLVTIPKELYAIDEYNMTQDRLIRQTGELFPGLPEGVHHYNEVNSFALTNFVHPDDIEECSRFSDRQRILDMFASGKTEDRCEYRSRQETNEYRWTMLYLQMIRDPYSNDVLAQLLFRDIDEEKTGIVRLRQDMQKLKQELEQSRIKVMINQMQPHFLYNALSAIQTIVKTDPDYAYQLIYDFTVHLRSSIKALSSDAPIPFRDELKNIDMCE